MTLTILMMPPRLKINDLIFFVHLQNKDLKGAQELYIGVAAASSRIWNQIIADVLGKRVISMNQSHTEVLVAAILAGAGLGVYPDYKKAIRQTVLTGEVYDPVPAAHEVYNRLFPVYIELYKDTEHHFKKPAHMELPQGWITKGILP